MYLQSNKTGRGHIVPDIGTRHSIDPGSDRITYSLDTSLIPLIVLESTFSCRILCQRIKPVATGLIIDATRPGTLRGINLKLIAVHASFLVVFLAFTAQLHTRIQAIIYFEIKLQDKITIRLLCSQKCVRCSHLRNADNSTIYHFVFGFTIQLLPATQVLPIEKRLPVLRRNHRCTKHKQKQQIILFHIDISSIDYLILCNYSL